jgi:lipocalin
MNTRMILSLLMMIGGLAILLLITTSWAPARGVNNSTVGTVDWGRYTGSWYEIARKPHSFEKGMSHVKATYTARPDGTIEVRNEGIKNGKNKVTKGKARTTDTPGKLKVTFFIFPAQYNVLEVAPDYSYAVVGGSNDSYLWVLSRTPQMDAATLEEIYGRLEKRGYDLSDLIIVEQD